MSVFYGHILGDINNRINGWYLYVTVYRQLDLTQKLPPRYQRTLRDKVPSRRNLPDIDRLLFVLEYLNGFLHFVVNVGRENIPLSEAEVVELDRLEEVAGIGVVARADF